MASDRRVFYFTHTQNPNQPLIVVNIALTRSISDNISDILDSRGMYIYLKILSFHSPFYYAFVLFTNFPRIVEYLDNYKSKININL